MEITGEDFLVFQNATIRWSVRELLEDKGCDSSEAADMSRFALMVYFAARFQDSRIDEAGVVFPQKKNCVFEICSFGGNRICDPD